MSEFFWKFGRSSNHCKRRVVPVLQMNVASLACLFVRPCVSPAGMWQAGKQEGRRAGGRTQARSEADEVGGVKGHNDQMIGTTEGKCVDM